MRRWMGPACVWFREGASEQGSAPTSGPAAGLEFVRSRPEVLVGAAFAGGMIMAFLLRRLGH